MKLPLLSSIELIKILRKMRFKEIRQKVGAVINILNILMEELRLFLYILGERYWKRIIEKNP